jgi:hypothetical protein
MVYDVHIINLEKKHVDLYFNHSGFRYIYEKSIKKRIDRDFLVTHKIS